MKKTCLSSLSVFCLLAFSLSALAAPAQPTPVPTHLKRVALFKNGLGFFIREGSLTGDTSVALLGPFAAPAHGTFWVSCPSRAGLRSTVAREATAVEEVAARDIGELLRANVGREITILTGADPESGITGKIIAFAPDRTPTRPAPYAMGQPSDSGQILPPGRGQFMLFQTDKGIIALDPYRIWSVEFPSGDVGRTFLREAKQVEMEAAFASSRAGDWLSVSYLAKGITWAPSYLIDISEPKEARLTAKALILNEAEDLDGTHVDLITGFPNLQFADILSPIGEKEDLASFLQSLTRGRSEHARGSVVTQNVMYAGVALREEMGRALPDYGAAAAGQVAEDLFLYPVEDVSLARGETGYYPLFSESVSYSEFHRWEIPDYISEQDRYGQRQSEERDKPEEVWHCLRLDNTTKVPWTTAPAQLMKNGTIIGQDTLKYTPANGEATVKITQAVSVKAEQAEVEVERERDAVRLYGDHFDRVTLEGTLEVTNFKPKPISLEIEKTLSGEFNGTSHTAQQTTLARGLARVNPIHVLTWTIDLKPAESKEITYTYQALIRR